MHLTKKFTILCLLIFCSFQMGFACCAGEQLRVFPSSDHIAQNPIFLVEFSGIKPNLKKYKRIYLKDQKGKQINLEIIEGYGNSERITNRQQYDYQDRFVLLKPEKKLARNAVVSMVVETGMEIDARMKIEIERLQKKSWKVKFKSDKRDPILGPEITAKYHGHFNSSASGHSIRLNMQAMDNYTYVPSFPANFTEERKLKYPRKPEMLIELKDEAGNKYIYPLSDGSFSLSNGACYRNFKLPNRIKEGEIMRYRFEARLMDFSGNISKDTRLIKINIKNKKREKRKKVTINGVDYYHDNSGCNNKLGPTTVSMDGASWINVGSKNNCTYLDVYLAVNSMDGKDEDLKAQKLVTDDFLKQNIPNPANKKTIINYYLAPDSKNAILKITDVSGRTVQSIPLPENGHQQVHVDCSEMSVGIYFYTLMVEGQIKETRKMILE